MRVLLKRFRDKIKVNHMTGCWEWTGALGSENGYGRFWVGGASGTAVYAHRYAYERLVGQIPAGFVIDHLCRNRVCVNPNHLRACTQKENTLARYTRPPTEVCAGHVLPAVDQATIFDVDVESDPTPAHGTERPQLRQAAS